MSKQSSRIGSEDCHIRDSILTALMRTEQLWRYWGGRWRVGGWPVKGKFCFCFCFCVAEEVEGVVVDDDRWRIL